MTRMTLANDASGRDIQRREQRRRPVSYVIMRPALGLSRTHRQQRRGAIERFDPPLEDAAPYDAIGEGPKAGSFRMRLARP